MGRRRKYSAVATARATLRRTSARLLIGSLRYQLSK
jgi:hypothetical protein